MKVLTGNGEYQRERDLTSIQSRRIDDIAQKIATNSRYLSYGEVSAVEAAENLSKNEALTALKGELDYIGQAKFQIEMTSNGMKALLDLHKRAAILSTESNELSWTNPNFGKIIANKATTLLDELEAILNTGAFSGGAIGPAVKDLRNNAELQNDGSISMDYYLGDDYKQSVIVGGVAAEFGITAKDANIKELIRALQMLRQASYENSGQAFAILERTGPELLAKSSRSGMLQAQVNRYIAKVEEKQSDVEALPGSRLTPSEVLALSSTLREETQVLRTLMSLFDFLSKGMSLADHL